jgi:hypothetical protein
VLANADLGGGGCECRGWGQVGQCGHERDETDHVGAFQRLGREGAQFYNML